jgi:hypothetical protein
MRRRRAAGPESRTVGGGSSAVVSRVTVERERARGQKFATCGDREHEPEILVWAPNARRSPSTRVSLFLVLETRVLVAHLTFHYKGRQASSCASCIDPKEDVLQTDASPFSLPRQAGY